jgi:hypothetical protein
MLIFLKKRTKKDPVKRSIASKYLLMLIILLIIERRGLKYRSSGRAPTDQAQGPEFKPHYCKNKQKNP